VVGVVVDVVVDWVSAVVWVVVGACALVVVAGRVVDVSITFGGSVVGGFSDVVVVSSVDSMGCVVVVSSRSHTPFPSRSRQHPLPSFM